LQSFTRVFSGYLHLLMRICVQQFVCELNMLKLGPLSNVNGYRT